MENVTYTKNQLADFSVKELKTLPLFAKIDPKGLDKAGIVNAMFKAQEEANIPQVEEVVEPKEDNVEEAKSEATEVEATDEVNTEKEEIQSEKSEKVVFHRGNNVRRNPMTFR